MLNTKEELVRKYNELRRKWINNVPREGTKEYWSYRLDRSRAIEIRSQLISMRELEEKSSGEEKIKTVADMKFEDLQAIFLMPEKVEQATS